MLFGKIFASLSSTLIGQKPDEILPPSGGYPMDIRGISDFMALLFPHIVFRYLVAQRFPNLYSFRYKSISGKRNYLRSSSDDEYIATPFS